MASQLDIARVTGISQSIISRVLSGRWEESKIARKTADKVLRTAAELGYQPNRAANIVFGRKTNLIGVIVRSFHDPYLTIVLDEINERASADDLGVVVAGLSPGENPLKPFNLLLGYRPDAVIVVGTVDFSGWKEVLSASDRKVIQIGSKSKVRGVITCGADEPHGAELLMEHLYELGHRGIGFVRDRSIASGIREQALQRALECRGLGLLDEMIFEGCSQTGEPEGDGFERLLHEIVERRLTAVVCAGDMIAAGFARRLVQAGIRIPQEVSLASYNDVPLAALLNPPLTTVHLPVRELAGAAMDMAAGRRPARSLVIRPTLVVRESSTPPPASISA